MNRKGEEGFNWTAGRIAKILLAVIGVIFVIVAGTKLASFWIGKQEVRNSEVLLKSLVEKLEGVNETGDFVIRGVEDWYLFAWDKDEKGTKPDECFFGSCICVCPNYDAQSCSGGSAACESLDYDEIELFMYSVVEDKEKTFFPEEVIKDRQIIENYQDYGGRTTADVSYEGILGISGTLNFKYNLLTDCVFLDAKLREVLVNKEGNRATLFVLLNLNLDDPYGDENLPSGIWKMRAACEK